MGKKDASRRRPVANKKLPRDLGAPGATLLWRRGRRAGTACWPLSGVRASGEGQACGRAARTMRRKKEVEAGEREEWEGRDHKGIILVSSVRVDQRELPSGAAMRLGCGEGGPSRCGNR